MQLLTAALGLVALCARSAHAELLSANVENGTFPQQYNFGDDVYFNGQVIPYGVRAETAIGPRTVKDLMVAISVRENYAPNVGRPICVTEVSKASVQLLQNINYLFQVKGCAQTFLDTLGACEGQGCVETALWEVKVSVQESNHTYRVEGIRFLE